MEQSIIRRIDDLGRIAIPKDIRRMLRLSDGDALEISASGEDKTITLKPYFSWDEHLRKQVVRLQLALRQEYTDMRINLYQGTKRLYNPSARRDADVLEGADYGKVRDLVEEADMKGYPCMDKEAGISVIPIKDRDNPTLDGFIVGAQTKEKNVAQLEAFTTVARMLAKFFVMETQE